MAKTGIIAVEFPLESCDKTDVYSFLRIRDSSYFMAGRGGDGGGGRGYENLCPEFVGVRIVLYDLGGGRNLLCPFKIKFCLCISIQRPD